MFSTLSVYSTQTVIHVYKFLENPQLRHGVNGCNAKLGFKVLPLSIE